MRSVLAAVVSTALLSCASPTLDNVIIGTRRGEQDAVVPAEEIEAGSRKDIVATVDVRNPTWVYATWTAWTKEGRPLRIVHWRMFNVEEPKTIFVDLDGDTEGGWKEGTITIDFKTADGEIAATKIRVVPKR